MAINTRKRLKFLRGNTAQTSTFTGLEAELTVNTDDWSLRVHDGVTPGGNPVATIPGNVSAFTNDAGYITANALPVVPTVVSAFTNDAGYITANALPVVPTVVSAFTNDAGYITLGDVPTGGAATTTATSTGLESQVLSLKNPFQRDFSGAFTYDHIVDTDVQNLPGARLCSYDDYSGTFTLRRSGTYRIQVSYNIYHLHEFNSMYPGRTTAGSIVSTGAPGMQVLTSRPEVQTWEPAGENGDSFVQSSNIKAVVGYNDVTITTGLGPDSFERGYNFQIGMRAGGYGFENQFYDMSMTVVVTRLGDEPDPLLLIDETFDVDAQTMSAVLSVDEDAVGYPYYAFNENIDNFGVANGEAYNTVRLGGAVDALLDYNLFQTPYTKYYVEALINIPAELLESGNNSVFSLMARIQEPLFGQSTSSGGNGQNFIKADIMPSTATWAFPGVGAIGQSVLAGEPATGAVPLTAGDHTVRIEIDTFVAYFYIDGEYYSTSEYTTVDGGPTWDIPGYVGIGITKSADLESIKVKNLKIYAIPSVG